MTGNAAAKKEEPVIEPGTEDNAEFEDAFNTEAAKKDGTELPSSEKKDPYPAPGEAAATADAVADAGTKDDPAAIEAARKAEEAKQFEGWPQDAIDRYKAQEQTNADLEHRISSDSGRVSAFQLKVNDLEKEITKIKAGGGNQPTKEEIKDAMTGSDEEWTEFSKDYPEVAGAIDKRFEAQQKNIDARVGESLAPVLEKQENDEAKALEVAEQEANDAVSKDYPTWQTEVAKPEFSTWMATQPPGIQALADSDDRADASTLIGMYDTFRVAEGHPTLKVNPAEPGAGDGSKEVKGDVLSEKRAQQLEDGASVKSKAARIDPDAEVGDEFEQAFNVYAEKKAAKNK